MNDRFLSLFFEESHELLQALEAGLMDLELRQGDREHLDRTFRAAHTLKGAAGMVGLRPIAEFTHKVEAVLDAIRSGRMAVTREAITILLRAKDHLGAALDAAAGGQPTAAPADLEEALVGTQGGTDRCCAEPEPKKDDTGSLPVKASDLPEARTSPSRAVPAEGLVRRYRIDFRPRPDLLRKGIDPLGFLDELRELGERTGHGPHRCRPSPRGFDTDGLPPGLDGRSAHAASGGRSSRRSSSSWMSLAR